jgi:glutamate--cysteine ligase
MQGICEMLDAGDAQRPYSAALAVQVAKLDDPALAPSAKLVTELRATGESFFDLALRTSATHKAYFRDLHAPDAARIAQFTAETAESLQRAEALERAPQGDFDAFLAAYLA